MKTNEIAKILMHSLYSKSRGIFCTSYKGMGFAECDVLRITDSNIVYEVEGKDSKVIKKAPKLHSFKATDKLIRKVCDLLSVRAIFGSSYVNYISKFKN